MQRCREQIYRCGYLRRDFSGIPHAASTRETRPGPYHNREQKVPNACFCARKTHHSLPTVIHFTGSRMPPLQFIRPPLPCWRYRVLEVLSILHVSSRIVVCIVFCCMYRVLRYIQDMLLYTVPNPEWGSKDPPACEEIVIPLDSPAPCADPLLYTTQVRLHWNALRLYDNAPPNQHVGRRSRSAEQYEQRLASGVIRGMVLCVCVCVCVYVSSDSCRWESLSWSKYATL